MFWPTADKGRPLVFSLTAEAWENDAECFLSPHAARILTRKTTELTFFHPEYD